MNAQRNGVKQLHDYLVSLKQGRMRAPQKEEVDRLVSLCWNELHIVEQGHGMEAGKVLDRMENVSWSFPELSFEMERHGGTVMGSSRAERQQWTINVETAEARWGVVGHRQVTSMQSGVDVEPFVNEIVNLVERHRVDRRLTWFNDGTVRVLTGEIFPYGSAVKTTLAGRRKRFIDQVTVMLKARGWERIDGRAPYTYHRISRKTDAATRTA